MGIEPGGTTLAGARTVLKPVSQTDPYLQQTSLSLTNTKLLSAQAQPSSSSEAKPSTSGLQSNLLTSDNANGAGASTSGKILHTINSLRRFNYLLYSMFRVSINYNDAHVEKSGPQEGLHSELWPNGAGHKAGAWKYLW